MKTIKIKNPIYKCDVLVIYGCSPKECNDYLKRKKLAPDIRSEDDLDFVGTLYKTNQGVYRILYVDKISKTPAQLAILSHEVLHLVVEICSDKGIPVVGRSTDGWRYDEASCYLLEFYMREILSKI